MTHDRNAFKAGLFILSSIALIVGVIVGIKGIGRLIEPRQIRQAQFKLSDDLGGLRSGDDVRVGGLKVGVVRDIEIAGTGAGPRTSIIVTFDMPRRLTVRDGVRIRVQSPLTGASCLNIEDLGGGAVVGENIAVAGLPSSYAMFMSSLSDAAPEVTGLLRDVRTVTVPKVNDTLTTFKDTGQRASEAMAQVRDLVGDTKSDIRATMSNVNVATASIKEKVPGLLDKVDGALVKVQASLDGAHAALEDVKKTAANARDLTASARSLIVTNRGKIDAMVASLKTAGDNLKFATAEIRRSPWRLLYKPSAGEMANLNLYDSARQFAEGAGSMNDAATALRDALKDPNIDQEAVKKLVEKLDASFTGFKKVEADLWKQVQPE